MNVQGTCPDAGVLEDLILGRGSPEQAAALEEHLSHCAACATVISQLEARDTLVEALEAQGARPGVELGEAAARLMDKLTRLRRQAGLAAAGETIEETAADVARISNPSSTSATKSASLPPPAEFVSDETQEAFDLLSPPQAAGEMGRLGPYRVLKVLGIGGMGVVFEAEDPKLKRRVALKAMKPALAASTSARQRFLREAQAIAALDHDHIVHVYQVDEDRNTPFLAMQLLHGETLETRLKRDQKLPLREAVRIAREIATGLAAAHRRNLIHRDIKPANIWLEQDTGRIKIMDFGLARALGGDTNLTQEGAILGTPAYMAPEQACGEPADHRSDLFSLGAILYRMLTGSVPFQGTDTLSILRAVSLVEPTPPSKIDREVPRSLSDLTMRLLAKERDKRPVSAQAVVEALAQIERDSDEHTTIVPGRPRGRKHPPARRYVVAASFLLLAGLLAGGILLRIRTPDGKIEERRFPPGTKIEVSADDRDGKNARGSLPALPCALDDLDPAKIPEEDRIPGLPRHVVAVLGTHRGWLGIVGGLDVAYSPNGKLVATWTGDVVRLWDATDLRQRGVVNGGGYSAIAFSPDGKTLACGTGGGEVRLWDVTGQEVIEQSAFKSAAARVRYLAYAPDGKTLACLCDDKKVHLWALTAKPPQERVVLENADWTDRGGHPSFSADSKLLAYAGREAAYLYDLSTPQPKERSVYRDKEITVAALSPDAKKLAIILGHGRLRLLDLTGAAPKRIAEFGWNANIHRLAFSPDGKLLAAGMEGPTRLIDVSGPDPKERTPVIQTDNAAIGFSPDGKTLATASILPIPTGSQYGSLLRLWDVTGPEPRARAPRRGHNLKVVSVAICPDGKTVASGSADGTIRLWRAAGGRFEEGAVLEKLGWVWGVRFSSDGKTLLSMSPSGVRLWDLTGPQPKESDVIKPTGGAVFSPDGRTLGVATENHVRLYDLAQRPPREKAILMRHLAQVHSLAFSPDGKMLASGSADRSIRLWDLTAAVPRTRAVLHQPLEVYHVFFSPDGKTLAAEFRYSPWLRLWDLTGTEPTQRADMGKGLFGWGEPQLWSFAPDGKSLWTFHSVHLLQWFSATDMRAWLFPGGTWYPVDQFAVAPDGRHVVTANENGTLYVWRFPAATTAHPPLEESWVKKATAMPLEGRIDAVAAKLKERNPDFDGEMKVKIENNVLIDLNLQEKNLFDLAPLQVLQPRWLNLRLNPITDLSPLRGMKLEGADVAAWELSDLSPLKDAPLTQIRFDLHPGLDLSVLRSMKTLERINDKPAAEFWKEIDAKAAKEQPPLKPGAKAGKAAPTTEPWIVNLHKQPPYAQIAVIRKKLQQLNPDFDGKIISYEASAGIITSLAVSTTAIADISPLRALTGLKKLGIAGDSRLKKRLSDLSPLADLRLNWLLCANTMVRDLSPVKRMPLISLNCDESNVEDLSPLAGLPLQRLYLYGTPVRDLSPLRKCPLEVLGCQYSRVTDFSPIQKLPLKGIWVDYQPARDAAILRSIKTLEQINGRPAAKVLK